MQQQQRPLSEEERMQRELLAIRAANHERELLAISLRSPVAARQVVSALAPSDFYVFRHRWIIEAIAALLERGVLPSLIEVADELAKLGRLDEVGGLGGLTDLEEEAYTAASLNHYIGRVRKASTNRKLRAAGEAIIAAALDPEEPEPINKAYAALLAVEDPEQRDVVRHISDVITAKVSEIEAAYEARRRGEEPMVISSGFYDLDRKVLLTPQKLVILAARPAMGKSAIAFNIACHVAKTRPVLHVTLEMSGEELAGRLIAADLDLDANAQAYGAVPDERWDDLMALADRYAGHKLYINDTPAATMAQVEAAAMMLQAELREPLGLLLVDYLGLIDGDGKDETSKIGKISRAAKKLAKTLNVPVVMLCQLNRGVEGREDKRPQLQDLRQSGAIEQDADVVMFAYREEYYDPETDKKGLAELLVRKNRGGGVGTVFLKFDAAKTQFSNVEYDPQEGPYGI